MMNELVLLVEGEGSATRLRPWILKQLGIHEILERCNMGDDHQFTRLWRCTDGERALTGQRIFREVIETISEPSENPVFQETTLKTPLRFSDDETPGGFRRKHLRKV